MDRVEVSRIAQDDRLAETLAFEVAYRLVGGGTQPREVVTNHLFVHDPSDPAGIACEDDFGRQIEDDRNGGHARGDRAP